MHFSTTFTAFFDYFPAFMELAVCSLLLTSLPF